MYNLQKTFSKPEMISMSKHTFNGLLGVLLCIYSPLSTCWSQENHNESIRNPSFESDNGWRRLQTESNEYYAPVHGTRYAVLNGSGNKIEQETSLKLSKGKLFHVTVWARSIFDENHSQQLTSPTQDYPDGTSETSHIRLELRIGNKPLAENEVAINPIEILGAPREFSNDDGGNIWIDGGYRHAFSESRFVQRLELDPIYDPWEIAPDFEDYQRAQEDHGAVCPVIVRDRKLLYVSTFEDPEGEQEEYHAIQYIEPTGEGAPNYHWPAAPPEKYENLVLSHAGDEDIIAFDPYVFFDELDQRLWMAWGGNFIAVTELNPETGLLLHEQENPEVTTHEKIHARVADRATNQEDVWTGDNEWIEGAAIYRKNNFWYLFGSYGSLMTSYTIRMGRSRDPMGPYVDKDGIPLTQFNKQKRRFGNSFFLGDDGAQLVPGHPHFWEEDGQTFVGYDYRKSKKRVNGTEESPDIFGIRKVYWRHGWPTIWTPISVSVSAEQHPDLLGQNIVLLIENTGDPGSTVAVDNVSCSDVTHNE